MTQEERVPSLASNLAEPFNAAKRIKFDINGEIVNPAYSIYNYNTRTGSLKFEKVWFIYSPRM